MSVLGGEPVKLRDHAIVCSVSPVGSTISFATNKGKHGEREVWLMQPSGEQARKYFEASAGTGVDCWGWSLDGKYYGWVLNDESGTRIMSQAAKGGPVVTLFDVPELKKINDIVWLHDGRVVYDVLEPETGVCNYWIARIDPDTGRRVEKPRRLTNWPSFCVASGSVTNDDKKIAFAAWSGAITSYVADLEQRGTHIRNSRHFTQEEADAYALAWTPDGKAVFYAAHRVPDEYALFRQPLDSNVPEALVSFRSGGWINYGVLSPDGRWLIALVWPPEDPDFADRLNVPLPMVRIPVAGGTPEEILKLASPAIVSCARAPART